MRLSADHAKRAVGAIAPRRGALSKPHRARCPARTAWPPGPAAARAGCGVERTRLS